MTGYENYNTRSGRLWVGYYLYIELAGRVFNMWTRTLIDNRVDL
jgi:hypothetical protein